MGITEYKPLKIEKEEVEDLLSRWLKSDQYSIYENNSGYHIRVLKFETTFYKWEISYQRVIDLLDYLHV